MNLQTDTYILVHNEQGATLGYSPRSGVNNYQQWFEV